MQTFRNRIALYGGDGLFLRTINADLARQAIERGAEVISRRQGSVAAIKLHEGQVIALDSITRPGSYGICKDLTTVPGHLVYGHRRTWDAADARREMRRAA